MEQLLDSNTGGPVPSSMRQKDSTVFVRLNNPADFDRAKSILESRQNVDSINMFSSISRSSKLYPAVALFVDFSLLPGLKNELMLRNEAFKGKIDSVTQIYKKPGTNKGQVKIFFNFRDIRDYALMGGEVDFGELSASQFCTNIALRIARRVKTTLASSCSRLLSQVFPLFHLSQNCPHFSG